MSTLLGAPPNEWKPKERGQMRNIHRIYKEHVFRNSDGFEDATTWDKEEPVEKALDPDAPAGEEDREAYLPKDCVLRSVDGEMRKPLNVPWRDTESFRSQMGVDYWSSNFRKQAQDRVLSETAQSIISHICVSQSEGSVRSRNGSMPLGSCLRVKREHIAPLSLVLHDLKTWCVHYLRNANPYEKATINEISNRINYVQRLQDQEVWGAVSHPPRSGMRSGTHDKLFRLLLTVKESLTRARDYAYRTYAQRASREKLFRLSNLLKDVVFTQFRVLSGAIDLEQCLVDPSTRALQPTDLLNSSQNQNFVYWPNLANVCLAEVCELPLLRAVLLSDYDSDDVADSLLNIGKWEQCNLFKRGSVYLFEDSERHSKGILPKVYKVSSEKITKRVKAKDPHVVLPRTRKEHAKLLNHTFKGSAVKVMQCFMDALAAIQDFIPMLYVVFELHAMAGAGGDFTVYDTLRKNVIAAMDKGVQCLQKIQAAERVLIVTLTKEAEEEASRNELRRLKSKKASPLPAWVRNLTFLKQNTLLVSRRSFQQSIEQLEEIKRDAMEYNLTSDQLSKKIQRFKDVCDLVCGQTNGANPQT